MGPSHMIVMLLVSTTAVFASQILMITLGGTSSHKVPFLALGRALVSHHNVTLLSAFPPGSHFSDSAPEPESIEEIAPPALSEAVETFSNMDVLGNKLRGQSAYSVVDVLNFAYKMCETFYSLPQTHQLLSANVDLLILDGAFPECLLGLVVHFHCPFVLLNTVAFHTIQLSAGGNPVLPSVNPFFDNPYSDRMNLWERTVNGVYHVGAHAFEFVLNKMYMEPVVRRKLGPNIPPNSEIGRNVSLILQNGHHTVTYPRPLLPSVVEVACLQCIPPRRLPQELEDFIREGEGFIYVSFGTSVRSSQITLELRSLLIRVFGSLPYQVLWKYEVENTTDLQLPSNVMVSSWFPQQDLLGHPMITVFVNHGGLHGVMEAVYHRVPMVLLPIFCDHATNSRKAQDDGYAEVLEWHSLTEHLLRNTIVKVAAERRYKDRVSHRSVLLRDQPEPPLNRALYWVEYVLRHNGAAHLQSPAKDLSTAQYYMLDSLALLGVILYSSARLARIVGTRVLRRRKTTKCKIN